MEMPHLTLGLVAPSLLLLAACGGGTPDGKDLGREKTPESAAEVVVALASAITDSDFESACGLIDPARRADTCEASVQALRAEQGDAIAKVTTANVGRPVASARDLCAIKFGSGGPGLGSVALTWDGESWAVADIGALDDSEFVGEPLNDVTEYQCQ